ncbi:YciI family protein [Chitinophaga ginsengisoli]|uniref:YCII-related domain-containing protein n=1 Tax=Chitinophaga ginsengisoli TaxID=363837 RepID=A0A2P8GHE3_9BACT|nr:hypothetical protein [Chitinophaga ginsengisoli]PSL33396.1 hypothetical protein CLV42_103379 [Chitinophaga ginsengisoli]
MNYGAPHGVLLFFKRGKNWSREDRTAYLAAQTAFYGQLQQQGKVLQTSRLVHEDGLFVSLSISSDTELSIILANDPAIQAGVSQVIHAVPVMF